MKRIKEYLNKHPKLKRIVKILGVVAIVFSFLFNAVIIASAIITANNNDVKQPLVYEQRQVVKDAPRIREGYTLFNINADLITIEFLNSLLNYENERSGFADYINIGELILDGVGSYQNCYAGIGTGGSATGLFGWAVFYSEDPNGFADFYNEQRGIKVMRVSVDSTDEYIAVSGNRYYKEFTFSLTLLDYQNTIITNYPFSVGAYYTSSFGLESYFIFNKTNALRFVIVNDYVINTLGSNLLLNLYNDSQPGYQIGYEQGYNNGLANAHTQNEGVFGLIAQAFNSVSSIFNIVLIPGITIGTLIAVPLIVMVIIVLFKMFRG